MRAAVVPRQLTFAADGQEALELLRASSAYRPDFIRLDLNMPRLNGRELLVLLKADSDLRRIPVVMFTTSAAQEDVASRYQRHVNAYVTKPGDLDGVISAVHSIDEFFTEISTLPPHDTPRP